MDSRAYQSRDRVSILNQKRAGVAQTPLKSQFSVFIGEFVEQEYEFMHNKIISYFKQFLQSPHSLFFFKFESAEVDFDKKINMQFPAARGPVGPSDSNAEGFIQPFLYELSAYSSQAKRVVVNGNPVRLQIDPNTNQFAFLRSLDPRSSIQFSELPDLFVAILKETKIQSSEQEESGKHRTRKGSLKRIDSLFVESSIEIFKLNEQQPLLGAVCDNRKVDSQFSPKNISAFHRPEQSGIEKRKPVNRDFNFCGWYWVDERSHHTNFTFLIERLQVNMRTPYNLDPLQVPLEEMQSRINFAKNETSPDSAHFLSDF